MSDYVEFRGKQDGQVVFGVSGPLEFAGRECVRYGDLYASDGPVKIEMKINRRWKNVALLRPST